MADGNLIVLSDPCHGHRIGGIIDGTPMPGQVVQVKAGTEPVHGHFTWEPYNRAGTGVPWLVGILDMDGIQGRLKTDAYVDGTECFVYFPLPGDFLNMLIADPSGTGADSDFAIGDALVPEDGTGKLTDAGVGTGFYIFRPFVNMETYADMSSDTHLKVQFSGY